MVDIKENQKFDLRVKGFRLLPSFAGVLQEKICMHASLTKIIANYISEESLINADYYKKIKFKQPSFKEVTEASKA